MNITQYDSKTQTLIKEVLAQVQSMDEGILKTLAQLKKQANASGDDALKGFVCFYYATAYYSLEISYGKFRNYLKEAILLFQKAGDVEYLTRAYNFVGIDATQNGSFDVAYYYYMTAVRICENLEDTYYAGVVNANIAQIFQYLGDPEKARRLYRKSVRQATHKKEDVYYYHNMINGYYSEGQLSILLNDVKGAQRAAKKMEHFVEEAGERGRASTEISVSFLRAELAYLTEGKKAFEKKLAVSLSLLPDAHQLFDCTDDIQMFCDFLLAHDEVKAVRRILDSVSETVRASGVTQMMKIMSEIEIAYYEKTGNRRQVIKHLEEQRSLAEKQQREQNRIYLYSIELINAMDNLRKEQARMKSENEILQVQAMTDSLTGIPNRLAMNKLLESAFERAYKNKTSVCIEILDVDRFKEFNDTYGHQEGDTCLRRIAGELNMLAVAKDIHCARYGGDEFVMIYENMTDEEVLTYAHTLERRVEALNIRHASSPLSKIVTISQGLCNAVPTKKNKLWDFLTEADNALYEVKMKNRKGKVTDSVCLKHHHGFST